MVTLGSNKRAGSLVNQSAVQARSRDNRLRCAMLSLPQIGRASENIELSCAIQARRILQTQRRNFEEPYALERLRSGCSKCTSRPQIGDLLAKSALSRHWPRCRQVARLAQQQVAPA